MATTTKPRDKRTQPSRTTQGTDGADTAMPNVSDWIEHTFFSGDGPAVPPAVAMLRAAPFVSGTETFFDSLAQMQAEAARFGAQRMHRAMEAQAEMLACRSPAELQTTQPSYLEGMAADYAHEWSRMFGFGWRIGLGQPVPAPPEPDDERHATPV